MADMQERLSLSNSDSTARMTGVIVIGAVVALFFLRRLTGSVSGSIGLTK